jgi:hypothetical protein
LALQCHHLRGNHCRARPLFKGSCGSMCGSCSRARARIVPRRGGRASKVTAACQFKECGDALRVSLSRTALSLPRRLVSGRRDRPLPSLQSRRRLSQGCELEGAPEKNEAVRMSAQTSPFAGTRIRTLKNCPKSPPRNRQNSAMIIMALNLQVRLMHKVTYLNVRS